MLAVKSNTARDRVVSGEWDSIFTTSISRNGPVLIWCHGNNGIVLNDYTTYNAQMRILAQRYKVYLADLGGNTFGNDTAMTRVNQVMAYAGVTKAYIVGASMGGVVALNYALRYPEKVYAVAGIIPGINLQDQIDRNTSAAANLNLAYPPAYDDAVYGSMYSPIHYASNLDPALPIKLWVSNNDPICRVQDAQAFVAARPQTELVNMGDYGHGGIDVAVPQVDEWLNQHC